MFTLRPVIEIQMLGGLSVLAGGVKLVHNSSKVNKPWQVLCYIVLNRHQSIPNVQLIQTIWPGENLTDPANVLKNTVYALRKEFKGLPGALSQPLLFHKGGYICNPEIEFHLDAEQFEWLAGKAINTPAPACVPLQQQAAGLYRGALLPQMAGEEWALSRQAYYAKLYMDCVSSLCAILQEQGRSSELLHFARTTSALYPLYEDTYLYIFKALYSLEMYRAVVAEYQRTCRLFDEQLVQGEEIRHLYSKASERINPIEQDIMIIKDDLREVNYDNSPPGGPLFCTYDVFKYLYQMVARTAERSGNRVLIILLSIQEKNGGLPADNALMSSMRMLRDGLLGGLLRKSDTVARYSKSQYIVMLPTEYSNGADAVTQRIQRYCEPKLGPLNQKILCATAELEP